jgi:hypothetical protein
MKAVAEMSGITGIELAQAAGTSTLHRRKMSGISSNKRVTCVSYCFLIWDHMPDRSACDLKLSKKRAVGKCIGICTSTNLGTNAFRVGSSNSCTPRCACIRIPGTDLLVVARSTLAHDELFTLEAAGWWHVCGHRTVYAATDVWSVPQKPEVSRVIQGHVQSS